MRESNGTDRREQPLVAVVCEVPLLAEAVAGTLEGIAEVRSFPARAGDTDGLLRSLRPDAVVVDTGEEASASVAYARDTGAPLVHVALREQKLRFLQDGTWDLTDGTGISPEAIRNVIVGGIFGRASA